MTDRELLEAAARAAGYKVSDTAPGPGFWIWTTPDDQDVWDPLTDDGDRYRLAKICELRIDFMSQYARTADGSQKFFWTTTGQGDDEAHAIVRAAAAMAPKEER